MTETEETDRNYCFCDDRFKMKPELSLRKHNINRERQKTQARLPKRERNTETIVLFMNVSEFKRFRIQTKRALRKKTNVTNVFLIKTKNHTTQTTTT